MKGFAGFPPGKQETVSIPAIFFSELLPYIDHLVELQVTLYCFWALHRQEGDFRYIRRAEILADTTFTGGIHPHPEQAAHLITDGLERAVARQTLLHLTLTLARGEEDFYFMNTVKGRNAITAIEQGNWIPGDTVRPIALVFERPNVYTLYEQNIGPLTPMIAQQLQDAENTYSATQVEAAIRIAVEKNVRNLRYIMGILKNQ